MKTCCDNAIVACDRENKRFLSGNEANLLLLNSNLALNLYSI